MTNVSVGHGLRSRLRGDTTGVPQITDDLLHGTKSAALGRLSKKDFEGVVDEASIKHARSIKNPACVTPWSRFDRVSPTFFDIGQGQRSNKMKRPPRGGPRYSDFNRDQATCAFRGLPRKTPGPPLLYLTSNVSEQVASSCLTAWLIGSPLADVTASAGRLECTRDPACSL